MESRQPIGPAGDRTELTHFLFPPYGIEFSDPDKLIRNWRANGLNVIEGSSGELQGDDVAFLRGFAGGGIVSCHDSQDRDRRVVEIDGMLKPRKYAQGTEVGNDDGLRQRGRTPVVLPDPVPRSFAKEMGIPPTRDPTVAATFEHIDLNGPGRYVLIVPRADRKLRADNRIIDGCAALHLYLRPAPVAVTAVIPNMEAWFGNPSRAMFLFEVAPSEECPLLQFAKLYYVAQFHEVSKDVPRLDSVHLLADFGVRKPSFRRFWTSNR